MGVRLSGSPTESYQLQSERKLPPGKRQKPECSCRRSAMVSGRNPCTLSAAISETVPMRRSPLPVPVISKVALSVSEFAVKLSGNFLYESEIVEMETV